MSEKKKWIIAGLLIYVALIAVVAGYTDMNTKAVIFITLTYSINWGGIMRIFGVQVFK